MAGRTGVAQENVWNRRWALCAPNAQPTACALGDHFLTRHDVAENVPTQKCSV